MGLDNRITLNEAVQNGFPYYLLELSDFGLSGVTPLLLSFDIDRSVLGLAIGPDSDIGKVNIVNRKFYESFLITVGPATFVFAFVTPVQTFDVETRAPVLGSIDAVTFIGQTVSPQGTAGYIGPSVPPPGAITLNDAVRYGSTYQKLDLSSGAFATDPAFISPKFQLMLVLQQGFESLKKRPSKLITRSDAKSAGPEVPVAIICISGRKKVAVDLTSAGAGADSTTFRATVAQGTGTFPQVAELSEIFPATAVNVGKTSFEANVDAEWLIIYGEVTAGASVPIDVRAELFD